MKNGNDDPLDIIIGDLAKSTPPKSPQREKSTIDLDSADALAASLVTLTSASPSQPLRPSRPAPPPPRKPNTTTTATTSIPPIPPPLSPEDVKKMRWKSLKAQAPQVRRPLNRMKHIRDLAACYGKEAAENATKAGWWRTRIGKMRFQRSFVTMGSPASMLIGQQRWSIALDGFSLGIPAAQQKQKQKQKQKTLTDAVSPAVVGAFGTSPSPPSPSDSSEGIGTPGKLAHHHHHHQRHRKSEAGTPEPSVMCPSPLSSSARSSATPRKVSDDFTLPPARSSTVPPPVPASPINAFTTTSPGPQTSPLLVSTPKKDPKCKHGEGGPPSPPGATVSPLLTPKKSDHVPGFGGHVAAAAAGTFKRKSATEAALTPIIIARRDPEPAETGRRKEREKATMHRGTSLHSVSTYDPKDVQPILRPSRGTHKSMPYSATSEEPILRGPMATTTGAASGWVSARKPTAIKEKPK